MKIKWFSIMLALFLVMGLTFGCGEPAPDTMPTDMPDESMVDEFAVLVEYLEGFGLDYPNVHGAWVFGHEVVLEDYVIIDIRDEADFAKEDAHFEGAVNAQGKDILSYVEENITTEKILVAGYTGMDSSYVTALLNMMGFEAYSLKFGMSYYLPGNGSDHEVVGAEDRWTEYVSDAGLDSEYWVFDEVSPEVPVYDGYPTLNTGKTTGPEILRARVEYALERGADPLMFDDIKGNLGDYNILNWWKTSYDGLTGNPYQVFGHLLGAVQFPPNEYKLVMDGGLTAIDPDRPNIIYCFTGQTSGLAEAYLVVLGYDVHGLAYGANSVVWSKMVGDNGKGFSRWPKPYGD